MAPERCKGAQLVTAFLQEARLPHRRVAEGEWGATLETASGPPLEVGLRAAGGLLAAQAWVLPPGRADDHVLLHRHRRTPLVRYAHSAAGDVHVQGELPLEGLTAAALDRLLAGLLDAAELARGGALER